MVHEFHRGSVKRCIRDIVGRKELVWDDHKIDISVPFERLSFEEAIHKYIPSLGDNSLESKDEIISHFKKLWTNRKYRYENYE